MHPKEWLWSWILLQVVAPLVGPILISIIVVFAWQTGNLNFCIDWPIIFDDISPWALTFYCITLGGYFQMREACGRRLGSHPALGGG